MSKYSFELDLSENTSTGKILNRIKKGSTVLEFGCATGRMTRYMKEAMNCRVYIVEYDQGAFEQALQYAEDGVCDDIMNFRWTERFAGIAFDAIIFADVLEHLPQPEQALKAAAAFLKEDGCVFVSVPNVTHNDIVLKMIDERFDYTRTGLLDDTHIHFWGLENIRLLGREAGLSVRHVDGTTCAAGDTEQQVQLGKNRLLENLLRQRQAGETYQFVVMLDKSGMEEQLCTVEAPAICSYIYLDTGKGFNPEQMLPVKSVRTGEDTYAAFYQITEVKDLCQVRLDPVEFQSVILRRVSISQEGNELPLTIPGGIQIDDGLYLPGDDPMVFAQVDPERGAVSVEAEFLIPGAEYMHIVESAVCAKQTRMEAAQLQHQQAQLGLQAEIGGLKAEIGSLHNLIGDQNKQIAAKELTIRLTQEHCDQLQNDVSAYISLVNQKEKLMIRLEQELCAAHAERSRYANLSTEKLVYISRIAARYQKLRAFAGRVLRKIKRCIKRILGRKSG